jgi:hypothetical protein
VSSSTGGDDDGGTDGVEHGDLYDALSNRRRRFAIHYLKQRPGERVGMGDLSTQVAAWEHGVDPEELSYDQRKTVHTALYQHHAPKLDETGLVDYDAARGEVELTAAGRDVDLYLEAVRGRDITWSTYFAGASGLAMSLVLATRAGVWPVAAVPDDVLCGFLAAGFLVSAVTFAYSTRQRRLGRDRAPPEATGDGG